VQWHHRHYLYRSVKPSITHYKKKGEFFGQHQQFFPPKVFFPEDGLCRQLSRVGW
jgi:hypothetical protein